MPAANMMHAVLAIPLAMLLCSCATPKYSALPMQAWVADAESGQPVEGVNVVAYWLLEGGLEGGSPAGSLEVLETLTDKEGKFEFPAWGPKKVPRGVSAKLKSVDPGLILFKSGYKPETRENSVTLKKMEGNEPVRSSEWDGKTIKLERFGGDMTSWQTLDQYADSLLFSLNEPLEWAVVRSYNPCHWKDIPLMLLALKRQRAIFEAAHVRKSTFIDSLLSIDQGYMIRIGCGSPREFTEGLGE